MPVLLDVREAEELDLAPFPYSVVHLPLSKPIDWIKDEVCKLDCNQKVVVICHRGIRSWNFGQWLIDQDFGLAVWNLDGGIDAWSVNIDPSVPRY